MSYFNTKSIARLAAVQTLYSYENAPENEKDLETALYKIITYYKENKIKHDLEIQEDSDSKVKPSYKHLKLITGYALEDQVAIDEQIEKYLFGDWSIDKMPTLLLCLLRAAISEIKFFPEIPTKVLVSEYTDVASCLLNDNEIGFVNSLLENCALNIRNENG